MAVALISVCAEIAPKSIRLADKFYKFGWNSAQPQKLRQRRGACYKILARWRRGLIQEDLCI